MFRSIIQSLYERNGQCIVEALIEFDSLNDNGYYAVLMDVLYDIDRQTYGQTINGCYYQQSLERRPVLERS